VTLDTYFLIVLGWPALLVCPGLVLLLLMALLAELFKSVLELDYVTTKRDFARVPQSGCLIASLLL
jgi:hypothetical protein